MQTLKFKVFHKATRKIYDIFAIDFFHNCVDIHGKNETIIFKFDEIEILSFIGVSDKNDKEIFQGDIVELDRGEHGKCVGFVCYSKDLCSNNLFFDLEGENFDSIFFLNKERVEVIGNIYENPEMLLKHIL